MMCIALVVVRNPISPLQVNVCVDVGIASTSKSLLSRLITWCSFLSQKPQTPNANAGFHHFGAAELVRLFQKVLCIIFNI